jgi:hypothetical protein
MHGNLIIDNVCTGGSRAALSNTKSKSLGSFVGAFTDEQRFYSGKISLFTSEDANAVRMSAYKARYMLTPF